MMIRGFSLREFVRIREFLPRLRRAQMALHSFFHRVDRGLRTPPAFDMRRRPPMKGISTHETDTWNITGRRSWVSDDALDSNSPRSTNSVGSFVAKGTV